MRTSIINHPENEPLIIIRQWQSVFCDGNVVAAFIIGAIHIDWEAQKTFATLLTYHNLQIALLDIYSVRKIKKALKMLEGIGALMQFGYSPEEIARRLKNKHPQKLVSGARHCEWCGCTTLRLQNHHYPISAKNNGVDTVSICANCHDEYHYLRDNDFYSPTRKLIELLECYPLESKEIIE